MLGRRKGRVAQPLAGVLQQGQQEGIVVGVTPDAGGFAQRFSSAEQPCCSLVVTAIRAQSGADLEQAFLDRQ